MVLNVKAMSRTSGIIVFVSKCPISVFSNGKKSATKDLGKLDGKR